MQNYIFKILFGFLITYFLNSCIQEDVTIYTNNLVLNQSYSVPVGSFKVSLADFSERDPSTNQLPSDSFTIDGSKIANVPLFYNKSYDFPFSINETDGSENKIKEVVFYVTIDNYFPTAIKTQVYFLDAFNNSVLTLFEKGTFSIDARKEDANNKFTASVKTNSVKINETKFAKLKTATTLRCQNTISIPNTVINFSLKDSIRVKIAFTVQLDVKTKEVGNGN